MPGRPPRTAWILLAALSAAGGCEDKVETLSSPRHLLDLQHEIWHSARQSLASEKPKLNLLASAAGMLGQRTRRRIKKDYAGANKAEVLAKLDALSRAYFAEVMSKLRMTEAGAALAPGASLEDVRRAFARIDPAYRQFEAMTAPPP